MVIKNLENKIRLTGIVCTAFLVGCVIISVSSIWTARTMVADAHKKVCAGRQCADTGPSDHNGRDTRRGSQEPCGDVPPLFLHAGAGRQVYPLYNGESHVSGGRDRTGTVQHPQGERLLQQHPRDERGLLHLLRQHPFRCGQDGVHLLRTAAHRAAKQHPDARACHRRTAQAGAPDGEQPPRAAHRELAHAAQQGHRTENKEQLLNEELRMKS